MISFVEENKNRETTFALLTECGIASRLQAEYPHLHFVGSCHMCKYMKSNSLENIRDALKNPKKEQLISIEKSIQEKAKNSLDAMFSFS